MEVKNGNRSRRSINQPYLKPLLFQIRGWFVNIMSRLSFQSVSNKQTLLSAPLVNKEFVKGIDDKTKVVPDIRSISAQSDINGRILLADMLLAKRGKRQMYTSSADKQISLQEAQGYSLNIVDKFEAELKQAAFRCGISVQQLKINFQEVQLSVLKKVIAGNYHEISGMLYSYAEKACPALEQKEKFSMSFKGKIEQMLQKEMMPLLDKANVDPSSVSTNKAVALSGPRTNLNNVSITTNSTELIR